MSLFFYAVSRFPEDIKLWLSFIKFCKVEVRKNNSICVRSASNFTLISQRKLSEVSKNLERMLKYHGNKEEMWKVAAYWEFLQCNNVETARGFLLTGLRHHPESEYIYSEVCVTQGCSSEYLNAHFAFIPFYLVGVPSLHIKVSFHYAPKYEFIEMIIIINYE